MKRNRRGLINQFILRNKALKEMGFKSYNDYLKSDIWIKTKIVWYKAKKRKPAYWGSCNLCGSKSNLVLHHMNYKFNNICKPTLVGKITLCEYCHNDFHKYSFANLKKNIHGALRMYKKYEKSKK